LKDIKRAGGADPGDALLKIKIRESRTQKIRNALKGGLK